MCPLIAAFVDSTSIEACVSVIIRRFVYTVLVLVSQGVFFGQVSLLATALPLPGHMCYLFRCYLDRAGYDSGYTGTVNVHAEPNLYAISGYVGVVLLFSVMRKWRGDST